MYKHSWKILDSFSFSPQPHSLSFCHCVIQFRLSNTQSLSLSFFIFSLVRSSCVCNVFRLQLFFLRFVLLFSTQIDALMSISVSLYVCVCVCAFEIWVKFHVFILVIELLLTQHLLKYCFFSGCRKKTTVFLS